MFVSLRTIICCKLCLFLSCVAIAKTPSATQLLLDLLGGSFSSAQQAAEDSSYFDIRLEMVRIWEDRQDAGWMYVEQAVASSLSKPYRQRIYRITEQPDESLHSEVYTLPGDPLRFAGWWRDPAAFDAIDPTQLELREGCTVILRHGADGSFEGSTQGSSCRSSLRGAAYATSSVRIEADEIMSWDRGFDDQDQQVWGAQKGGYRFRRVR